MKTKIMRVVDPNTGLPTNNVLFAYVKVGFPKLITPSLNTLNNNMEFAVDLIFPPDIDMSELEEVMEAAKEETWPDGAPNFKYPLIKDGNKNVSKKSGKPFTGYDGMLYVTAKSMEEYPPRVVDQTKKPITREDGIQGGDVVHVLARCKGYNHPANKGLSLWLNTVRLYEANPNPYGGAVGADVVDGVMDQYAENLDMI